MQIRGVFISVGFGILFMSSVYSQNVLPRTEAFVNYLDLTVNKVNLLKHHYPQYKGENRLISLKEDFPDTSDFDISRRLISSGYESSTVSRHATEMATIIGGAGNASDKGYGVANSVKLSSTSFDNVAPDEDEYFESQQILLQNHSYGFTMPDNRYGIEASEYDRQMFNNPNLVHIISAGNIGSVISESGTYSGIPGFANISGSFKMAKNPLVVGAIDEFGNVDPRNSKGPAFDGRIKPEITAYGKDGTSDAAALVSGVSILLQEAYEIKEFTPLSSSMLKSILIASAEDIGPAGIDYQTGYGNLDAHSAMELIENGNYTEGQLSTGEEVIIPIEVPENISEIRIAVSWTDPPAADGSQTALINDLDISLVDFNENKISPWVLNAYPHADSLSKPAYRGEDHLNTTEFISIDNPMMGTYMLHVKGQDIFQGEQVFSVSYEIREEISFSWTYPLEGDVLEADASVLVRWESNVNNDVQDIEYQFDGGNWTSTSSDLIESEYASWIIPDTLSVVRLRAILADNSIIESSAFYISPAVGLKVEYSCDTEVLLSWEKLEKADSYQLFSLENGILSMVGETTDTLINLPTNSLNQGFVRMFPIFNGTTLYGAPATEYNKEGVYCYFTNAFSRNVDNEYIQSAISLSTRINISSILFERSTDGQNFELLYMANISETNYYEVLDTEPFDEFAIYRISIQLESGEFVIADESTVYFPFDSTFYTYPNPVRSGGFFTLLLKPAGQTLKLYSNRGQVIKFWKINSEASEFDLPFLDQGMYFLSITELDGRVKTAKIFIN